MSLILPPVLCVSYIINVSRSPGFLFEHFFIVKKFWQEITGGKAMQMIVGVKIMSTHHFPIILEENHLSNSCQMVMIVSNGNETCIMKGWSSRHLRESFCLF